MALFASGDQVGRYTVTRPLHLSDRHELYLADASGDTFVLKTPSPLNPHRRGVCADMRAQFSFLDVTRCPVRGISCYEDLVELEELTVVSMRYVNADPVNRRIADSSWAASDRIEFLANVASTLDALHAYGVAHRDVSDSNVLLRDGVRSHLVDFDLSVRAPLTSDEQMSMVSGSAAFKAPEQWSGTEQDWRVDVFAFGILAYLVLAKQAPAVTSQNATIYRDQLRRLHASKRVTQFLTACLSTAANDRPSRCVELFEG